MVAPPPDNDVLFARALRHSLDGSPALLGASVSVRDGEILAIAGPRGSGKTTLMRCLSGQLVPDEGEVWFNSVPVHTLAASAREQLRRDRFGWVGPEADLLPELTAWENAALLLLLRGERHRRAKALALEWMERLDVGDVTLVRPAALTQAQRQRVAVARALAGGPQVVFADDPTAALHSGDAAHVLRTLVSAARSHALTVVLATSDPEVVPYADRTVVLVDGRLRTAGPAMPAQDHESTAARRASV